MSKTPERQRVESTIHEILKSSDKFSVPQVRDALKQQGFDFGTDEELIDFAERQKTRFFVGQLLDENGKRKFISTRQQIAFEFGKEHIYCPAENVKRVELQEQESLAWLRKHMISLIRRTPLLPSWAIEEIVLNINRVFEKIKKSA